MLEEAQKKSDKLKRELSKVKKIHIGAGLGVGILASALMCLGVLINQNKSEQNKKQNHFIVTGLPIVGAIIGQGISLKNSIPTSNLLKIGIGIEPKYLEIEEKCYKDLIEAFFKKEPSEKEINEFRKALAFFQKGIYPEDFCLREDFIKFDKTKFETMKNYRDESYKKIKDAYNQLNKNNIKNVCIGVGIGFITALAILLTKSGKTAKE